MTASIYTFGPTDISIPFHQFVNVIRDFRTQMISFFTAFLLRQGEKKGSLALLVGDYFTA